MKLFARFYTLAAALLAARASAAPPSEIVVAIRTLQAKGVSHAHLYLFREDGKLLRQLTRDNRGQDREPRFSPGGETIVFQREIPGKPVEVWSVEPLGKVLIKLPRAPKWYREEGRSAYFTLRETERPAVARTPDGRYELLLRETEEEKGVDIPDESGQHYVLRTVSTGKESPFPNLPGFEGAKGLVGRSDSPRQWFLWEPGLHVAFFEQHLNSTDGTTVYALDFDRLRFVRLSPNWATPIPLPGQPAFLTRTENRYVPIPGTTKTANCAYVERWGNGLTKVRYGTNAAAICYGASMYRPGKKPAVIDVR